MNAILQIQEILMLTGQGIKIPFSKDLGFRS
jgi:hypothetical protein